MVDCLMDMWVIFGDDIIKRLSRETVTFEVSKLRYDFKIFKNKNNTSPDIECQANFKYYNHLKSKG